MVHNKLWKILQEMGIPDHLICLLRNLYAGQEAKIRTGHGTTGWFQEEKETTEDEMVGWHHRLNGCEFEQALRVGDGQGRLACCSWWGCKVRHDWATELNRYDSKYGLSWYMSIYIPKKCILLSLGRMSLIYILIRSSCLIVWFTYWFFFLLSLSFLEWGLWNIWL